MDVYISSAQQPQGLVGTLQEDGTGGPSGGKLLLPTAAFRRGFSGDDIFKLISVTRISISF
jgi:hypothetical protein